MLKIDSCDMNNIRSQLSLITSNEVHKVHERAAS